jgi:hypothetical protein
MHGCQENEGRGRILNLKLRKSGKGFGNGNSVGRILALGEPTRKVVPFRKTPFLIF